MKKEYSLKKAKKNRFAKELKKQSELKTVIHEPNRPHKAAV
jgi:hypothetical protein